MDYGIEALNAFRPNFFGWNALLWLDKHDSEPSSDVLLSSWQFVLFFFLSWCTKGKKMNNLNCGTYFPHSPINYRSQWSVNCSCSNVVMAAAAFLNTEFRAASYTSSILFILHPYFSWIFFQSWSMRTWGATTFQIYSRILFLTEHIRCFQFIVLVPHFLFLSWLYFYKKYVFYSTIA